ncbi:unnamed protein product [Rotaria sordida]|uniref:Leucine-rich repeat-containing protein 45 n=1 Tax=Rotaria sordida TaxID=392033 RepID=A0A818ZEB7_9BILA|nr:unnamed protein product [Rotaria sordida]CAF3763735.1 unnamed protein product [Rotaria sordida]
MDQFKTLYYDYCKTYNVEPNEIILGEIQKISNEDNQTKIFNLSSLNIPEEQYTVLGKLFSHDSLYTSIHLNDCNLSSEALQAFLHGLVTNTTCRKLELKGNSIHGAGTEALAKVLRKNQTLQSLRLEWNQIGSMDSPAFSSFCDALSVNKSLIELDLRNNDISHVGGSELAAALKRNVTLRVLDLRWNNIGLVGSRALLAACQSNSTLNELNLTGNNAPDDIMENINNALAKNTEKRQIHFGHSQNMAILARQVQNIHTEKDRQITSVLKRVSLQEQAMLKANKSLAEKVKKLQETLNDQQLGFNAISAKNALLEADLTVATQQYNDAENEIKKMKIEKDHLIHQIRREYQQEKDGLLNIQEKFQRDLNENLEIQRRLNEKVHDLERKNETLQTTIYELRETITINDRDHHLKISSLDDENQRLKLKHKENLKDYELSSTRNIQRLKESYETTQQNLKEQITKLETIRTTLEREVNSLKSIISTQKLNHEEILQHEKLRLKNEGEKRQHELEDRLRSLITTKEQLESHYNQLLISNRDFQQKINFQSVEIETLKRQFESVQTVNLRKDTEILENREKLKTEYEKKLYLIQKDIEMNEQLKDRIKQLENTLKNQHNDGRNIMRKLETRITDLQAILHQRDQEISRLKRDEEKRLQFLRTAMLDYIGRGTKTN